VFLVSCFVIVISLVTTSVNFGDLVSFDFGNLRLGFGLYDVRLTHKDLQSRI